MSYAVRNSLILFLVLLLFAAGGWFYIEYYQVATLETLQKELSQKKQELQQNQEIASQFQPMSDSFEQASAFFENYEKALYTSSDEDRVYDFLTALNRGLAFNDFNFAFTDSTTAEKYGVMNMQITGEGSYGNVINFLRGIELSKPLNKISTISMTPIQVDQEYGRVSYDFELHSYYDRTKILDTPELTLLQRMQASVNNPFYPLIRDVKPNDSGAINVEQSTVVALSTDRVFLVDQNETMQQVRVGGAVYLGRLTSIDLNNRTATFTLNKGGITTKVTLGVENENE